MTPVSATPPRARSRVLGLGLGLALAVLALDQLTKWWILNEVMAPLPRVVEVTSFFNLVLVHNYGVSFGMFADDADVTRWALIAVALAVTGFLGRWLATTRRPYVATATGLVIGRSRDRQVPPANALRNIPNAKQTTRAAYRAVTRGVGPRLVCGVSSRWAPGLSS